MLVEIRSYLELYPQDDPHRFVEVMQRLDTTYLNAVSARERRKAKERK
jgi:hypothetical protein